MNEMERMLQFFLVNGRMEKQILRLKSLYMKELGLRGADLPVLFCLAAHPEGCRMDALSRATGADKSQISRSVASCMRADLVVREEGRAYKNRYALTEAGRRICEKLSGEAARIFEKAHARLEEPQWKAYYSFMNQLTETIEEEVSCKEGQAVPAPAETGESGPAAPGEERAPVGGRKTK